MILGVCTLTLALKSHYPFEGQNGFWVGSHGLTDSHHNLEFFLKDKKTHQLFGNINFISISVPKQKFCYPKSNMGDVREYTKNHKKSK